MNVVVTKINPSSSFLWKGRSLSTIHIECLSMKGSFVSCFFKFSFVRQ
jgi:hypothetical protein